MLVVAISSLIPVSYTHLYGLPLLNENLVFDKMPIAVIAFTIIALLIIVFFVLNLSLGTIAIPFDEVVRILLGRDGEGNEIWRNIIWKSRYPQTITALVAGAGLSISGLQMQTVFRNPLAGPSELGISSGASLGVATSILLSGSISQKALVRMGFVGEMAVSVAALLGALLVDVYKRQQLHHC